MGHCLSDIMEFDEVSYSVLVCDDDPDLAGNYVEKINAMELDEYRVSSVCNKVFRASTKELLGRRRAARDRKDRQRKSCVFDEVDILIIDYDLIHIDDDNTEYTGESLAHLARTFSSCAVVIVLNQFGQIDFDLRLRGHLASHADLNINADLVATPGLWRCPPWSGFRPWSWPVLSDAVRSQRARKRVLEGNMDSPLIRFLGMLPEDASRLSDSAFSFISPDVDDFEGLQTRTFEQFLSSTPNGKDARSLLDTPHSSAAVSFVAARIGKWLEREILGPQEVLIDVPHLLQRFPFLLGQDVSDIDAWNEAVHQTTRIREIIDTKFWFKPADCLSRPAVWCRRLGADDEFSRRRGDFDYSIVPNVAFMEDCSKFMDISQGTEFRAGFHNAFDRRFVKRIAGLRYRPQRRFAFGN